jgi:hypothetical protein
MSRASGCTSHRFHRWQPRSKGRPYRAALSARPIVGRDLDTLGPGYRSSTFVALGSIRYIGNNDQQAAFSRFLDWLKRKKYFAP